MSSFVGAIAIADMVKTTLGPKGMDKMLVSPDGEVTITNDGATILKQMLVDYVGKQYAYTRFTTGRPSYGSP